MTTLLDQLAEINEQLEKGVVEPKKNESEKLVDQAEEALPEQTEEPVSNEGEILSSQEDEEPDEMPNATGFRKMRLANKEIKKENETLKERLARLEGVVEGQRSAQPVTSKTETTAVEEDPEPNPIFTDEHNAWKLRKIQAKQEDQERIIREQQAKLAMADARNAIQVLENDFSKEKVDYVEAKKYLRNAILRETKIDDPNASDTDIQNYINHLEIQTAARIAAQGRNPAEYFYQKAQAKGYTAGVTTKEATITKSNTPNLDAIQRNKEKSGSLIGTPTSGAKPGKLSSSQLMDITVEQFARLSPEERENIR